MGPVAHRVPSLYGIDPTGRKEVEMMTELEDRIEEQRERAELMRKQTDCECPHTDCPVEHES